jgi:hypothetical protein
MRKMKELITLMKKHYNKWGVFVGFFAIIGLIVYAFIHSIWGEYTLCKHGRYTIGITSGIHYTGKGGKKQDYEYKVNHEHYNASEPYLSTQELGGRYYVKFSSKDPEISELLQDKLVPDSIKVAPPEGWEKLPE